MDTTSRSARPRLTPIMTTQRTAKAAYRARS